MTHDQNRSAQVAPMRDSAKRCSDRFASGALLRALVPSCPRALVSPCPRALLPPFRPRHLNPALTPLLLLFLLLASPAAWAAVRASVQPAQISLGNSATLTVESTETGVAPDLGELETQFTVLGQSRSSQTSIVNGQVSTSHSWIYEIEPRQAGELTIPPIRVGNALTEPLNLRVLPRSSTPQEDAEPVFLESSIENTRPYVQQALVYTLRLHYALSLVDGGIEAPAIDGASLQQFGEDRQYQVELQGRRYQVFERRFLLIPERSGELELPPARFRGRVQSGGSGFFGRVQSVGVQSEAIRLHVRAQPAQAPNPWLALRGLALARAEPAQPARAGEPLMMELLLSADGGSSAQLPDFVLPPIAGAQLFPEPAQRSDEVVGGQALARLRQRFAVVPLQAGELELPALRIAYWNTVSDRLDAAQVDALRIHVLPGSGSPLATAQADATQASTSAAAVSAPVGTEGSTIAVTALWPWQLATGLLALSTLLALLWAWQRGRPAAPPSAAAEAPARRPAADAMRLQSALALGGLRQIARALCASAQPPVRSLDALQEQLDDGAQRAACAALERSLWGGDGEVDEARLLGELRRAFRDAPRLRRPPTAAEASALPPLYPRREG